MTQIKNLIEATSTSTGTGDFTLVAANGRQPFSAFGTGGTDVFTYFIGHDGAVEWEVGTGHLSDATTLVRDTVIDSSNSGSPVDFSAGQKRVTNALPASLLLQLGGALGTPSSGTLTNCTGLPTSGVTHTNANTGAVARSLRTKLDLELVTVQDFGAVGDGVTSDQAAFTSAFATSLKNIFVPATGSSYILTSLSAVNKERLWGPGVVSVSGTITHIPTIPQNTSPDLAQLSIIDLDWQPSQTGAIIGSTKKCPIFIQTTRTGGYGAYGNIYVQGLVSDSIAATEFDVGVTAFMTGQNNGGGTIYGMWAAANSPSSALGHTYTGGWTIGLAVNSGNRWADFGEQTDIGGTRNSIGIQIGADVTPAADGGTAGFDGSFAVAINGSSQGHKWWCGIFHRTDTTPAGGRVRRTGGGSVVGNAPADLEIGTGHFVDGYDLSSCTISGNAFASPGWSVNGTGAFTATGNSSLTGKFTIDASALAAAGLLIHGDNATEPVVELQNTGAAGRTWRVVSGLTGVDNSSFSIYDATGLTTRLTINSSGNVGIGTGSTAPGDRLDVQSNGNANNFRLARFKNTTNGTSAVAGIEIAAGSPGSGLLIYHRAAAHSAGGSLAVVSNTTGGELHLSGANSNTEGLRIDSNHNVVAGTSAALATTATDGFLYVPTCAGTPTGTPTTKTGKAPIVVNTTNNKLYFYSSGAWRDAGP